jgi:multidrug resistance protein MdtO
MIFVTSAALLKYQYGLPGFELPKEIRVTQQEFDESLAQTLEGIADRMEGKAQRSDESDLQASLVRLERATELYHHREPPELSSMQMQSFLTLSRRIENLAASLDREFGWEDY